MAPPHLGRAGALGFAGLILCTASSASAQAAQPRAVLAAADRANVAGQWRAAEALYRQVLQGDSENGSALEGLAFVLAEQGRLEEAADVYREAIGAEPRAVRLLYSLAAVMDRIEPRRSLPLWTRYVAVAAEEPGERTYVALARERIRQLTAR